MPKFGTVESVRAGIPVATFKRARDILTSSKLQNVLFEGDLLQKGTALCQGSNPGESYKVTISVDENTSAFPTGHCSCPVRALCKHGVALLLKRVEELVKLERAGGGVSANGTSSTLERDMCPPCAVTASTKDTESASLEAARGVQSVEVVALSAGLGILPASMATSARLEAEDEKPAKRIAATKKPVPAVQRKRGASTKIGEHEGEDPTTSMGRTTGAREDRRDAQSEAPRRSSGRRQGEEDEGPKPPSKCRRGRSTGIEEIAEGEATRITDDVQAEAPKRSRKRSIQEDEVEESVGHDAEDEEEVQLLGHRRMTRGGNAKRRGEVGDDFNLSSPVLKRRKMRMETEDSGDLLGKEDVATQKADRSDREVVVSLNVDKGPTAGGGLDLTAQDLLRIAHEHLDGDIESRDGDTMSTAEVRVPRTKKQSTSIYCSSQWQDPVSQDYPTSVHLTPVEATETVVQSMPTLDRRPPSSSRVPESIVDEMLGIFLPPLKGETDKICTVRRTDVQEFAPADISDSWEVEPKAKKKISLKDRVMLYL